MSTMTSTPALTFYVGMLSTPADFSIFSALTVAFVNISCSSASTFSRRIGRCCLPGICGSQVLLDPHQSHSCICLSNTLSVMNLRILCQALP